MSPNLEDRIRQLINQAIAAKTESELDAILTELKAALIDHMHYVRAVSVAIAAQSKGAA